MRLHDAIRAAILAHLRGVHTGLPGRLEKYDFKTGKAQVKPLIQEPDASGQLRSLPIISGVPVIMPGGEGAALYLPPTIGDTGWIAFSQRSMELWLDRGGDADPGDPRILDMTDAVFFLGLRPFNAGSLAEEEGAAVLKNGLAKLKLRDGKVALGNPQAELLDLFDQLLTKLQTALTVDPFSVSGTPAGQPFMPPTILDFAAIQAKLALIKGSL